MNAWLILWEWAGQHAEVSDPLVGIFSARKSAKRIAKIVEWIYLHATSSAQDVVYFTNRRKSELFYKAEISGPRIVCGHHPYLEARLVSNLRCTTDKKGEWEILTWREPDTRKLCANKGRFEKLHEGEYKTLRRNAAESVLGIGKQRG